MCPIRVSWDSSIEARCIYIRSSKLLSDLRKGDSNLVKVTFLVTVFVPKILLVIVSNIVYLVTVIYNVCNSNHLVYERNKDS